MESCQETAKKGSNKKMGTGTSKTRSQSRLFEPVRNRPEITSRFVLRSARSPDHCGERHCWPRGSPEGGTPTGKPPALAGVPPSGGLRIEATDRLKAGLQRGKPPALPQQRTRPFRDVLAGPFLRPRLGCGPRFPEGPRGVRWTWGTLSRQLPAGGDSRNGVRRIRARPGTGRVITVQACC
jgi:hypothetical protein